MENTDHLNDRQRRYVEHVAAGMESRAAAKAAGYSPSFSRVAAHRLQKSPAVAQAIAEIRRAGMKAAVYDLTIAMKEANDAAAFAREKGNSMALVKAVELRSKLSGLLIDRIEVVPVDLSGALTRAEAGVINVTPLGAQSLMAPARWIPSVPGDEKPDAGPTDGQVGS